MTLVFDSEVMLITLRGSKDNEIYMLCQWQVLWLLHLQWRNCSDDYDDEVDNVDGNRDYDSYTDGERDMIIIRDFTDHCWCFVKSCCERALSGKAIDRQKITLKKTSLSLCDLKVSFKSIFLLPSTERRKNNGDGDGDHYSFAITDIQLTMERSTQ